MDDSIERDVTDPLDRGEAALVLSPSFIGDRRTTCLDLLAVGESSHDRVLFITFTNALDDLLDGWEDQFERPPGRIAFVSVDADSRSTAFDSSTPETEHHDEVDITVDRVQSPGNLTKFGVRITNRLEALDDIHESTGIVTCFDSITALLQYVEVEEAFRFLHVITDRLADVGATSHFHMDPSAHDDETVDTLVTLFDALYEYDDGTLMKSK